ncbi:MAG: GNAT family N-acyltransferase [Pseudomonadota bacterium]
MRGDLPRVSNDHLKPLGTVLGLMGDLSVVLAATAEDLDAAQALRYRVFAEEFRAVFPSESRRLRRDRDRFDAACDHLIVVDNSIEGSVYEKIVGTYRISIHRAGDVSSNAVYSQTEFDVMPMFQRHAATTFLELGRSCVLPAYRGRRTIELLWQGIWAYCRGHGVEAMFGCASLPGIDLEAHALPLSFLHHHARAKDAWAVKALSSRHHSMDLMDRDQIDMKQALASLPPLIKGYLRIGASFGEGAVIDDVFNTTDVLVILPVAHISRRYISHYGENAERFAA